jgi:hypothetical protein
MTIDQTALHHMIVSLGRHHGDLRLSMETYPLMHGSAFHVMLALHRGSRQVVVTDEEFASTNMIGKLLGKRQRVANQP